MGSGPQRDEGDGEAQDQPVVVDGALAQARRVGAGAGAGASRAARRRAAVPNVPRGERDAGVQVAREDGEEHEGAGGKAEDHWNLLGMERGKVKGGRRRLTDGVSQHHEPDGTPVHAAEPEQHHLRGGEERSDCLGGETGMEAVCLGNAKLEDAVGQLNGPVGQGQDQLTACRMTQDGLPEEDEQGLDVVCIVLCRCVSQDPVSEAESLTDVEEHQIETGRATGDVQLGIAHMGNDVVVLSRLDVAEAGDGVNLLRDGGQRV